MADAVSGFAELAQAGKARVLLVLEPKRYPQMPDVPTADELGLGIDMQAPFGLVGPKGMPREAIDKLHNAFRSAMNDPEYLRLLPQFHQVVWYRTSAEYSELAARTFREERKLVEEAGLLVQ